MKKDLEAQKEAQIAAQMAASLGYSNKENPFGDSNLSSKFIWVKKEDKLRKSGINHTDRMRQDAIKRDETQVTSLSFLFFSRN